ncbi:MAG TPA: FAD-dependent oxidoreductase [Gemmatimonadaceae bacterium]|jgi:geranylgeranyl reductase family protein|nr:FAD-dependent oxidoreductase [Gemmatimonadaceae bacterium]
MEAMLRDEKGADVVVVGGGPAGATTAFWLARAGVDVLLVDRARFPRTKPCAEYLSPQSSRVLDAMGVLHAIERSGAAQLAGMRVRSAAGTSFEGRFLAGHGYRGFRDRGLALPRFELDAILLAAAREAGARVIEGWKVLDVAQDGRGRAIGVVGERETLHARLVVGADGLRSVVARRLRLARRSASRERFAFVAHFTGVDGIGDHGEMHVAADGYVGLADIGRGRTNVALVVPGSHAAAARSGAAAFLDRWLAAQPQLAPRFARAARTTPVQVTGPFASHAKRAWASGAALVGDAADFFDPFTGEGIYSALRGGELLAPFAERAARASGPREADAALRDYDRAHRNEFRGKWLVERLIGLAVAHPPLLDRCARVLARRREMADLLVGVAGDFVPPREVLRARFLLDLLRPAPR